MVADRVFDRDERTWCLSCGIPLVDYYGHQAWHEAQEILSS